MCHNLTNTGKWNKVRRHEKGNDYIKIVKESIVLRIFLNLNLSFKLTFSVEG
jgi:hypothetical protein